MERPKKGRASRKKRKRNELKLLPNKMIVKVKMFGSLMEDGVFGDVDSGLTIQQKRND